MLFTKTCYRSVLSSLCALAILLPGIPVQAATRMNPGDVVSEVGYFFPLAEEKVIRLRLMEADYIEKRLGLQDTLIRDLNTRLDLEAKLTETYRTAFYNENDKLTKLLMSQVKVKWGMYILGVVTVIGGGLALGLAAKSVR